MKLVGAFRITLWRAQALSAYFHKMATSNIFGFPIFAQIDRVHHPLWIINGCIKYEFGMGIGVTFTWNTNIGVRRRRRRPPRKYNIPEILKFTINNCEYKTMQNRTWMVFCPTSTLNSYETPQHTCIWYTPGVSGVYIIANVNGSINLRDMGWLVPSGAVTSTRTYTWGSPPVLCIWNVSSSPRRQPVGCIPWPVA